MIFGEKLSEICKDGGCTHKNLADLFNVSTDYLLGRTSINQDYTSLNDEMIGKFSLYEYINETINLDKEHRLMLSKALQLIAL